MKKLLFKRLIIVLFTLSTQYVEHSEKMLKEGFNFASRIPDPTTNYQYASASLNTLRIILLFNSNENGEDV